MGKDLLNLLEKAFDAGRNMEYFGEYNIDLCIKEHGYYSFEQWIETIKTSESGLNIPDVMVQSEQFICPECGKQTTEWLDGICEDCTLKGFTGK